ncbi:hypothetical protein B0H21DRAFT_678119, partial [Amylocystis lapponica]
SWLGDTGTTAHIAHRREYFLEYRETPGGNINSMGSTPTLGRGTVQLWAVHDGKRTTFTLHDVVHAPSSPHNLISLGHV